MKKLIYIISIACVLVMVGSCKSQRTLSACDSLRHSHLTVFYEVPYPLFGNEPGTLILTQGGKHNGFGTCILTSYSANGVSMAEWKLDNDTLYIYPAFNIHPTDTNMLTTTQLSPGIDTVTGRYKIIGDGLYDITDATEYFKAQEKEFGVTLIGYAYQYEPNLRCPAYRMLRITKDKRKGY